MLLLGIDLGTSSVKVSVVDADSQQCLCTVQYPDNEAEIISVHPGWAEQSPDQWWEHVTQAVLKCHATGDYDPRSIAAIGIAYQMHGLVLIDRELQVIRNSIIWCDSRAVEIGDHAYHEIGEQACLSRLLNSPGNFTASKLAWVKENEPAIYNKIYKAMLPGDFISLKFSGVVTTTSSALSEGILWDYQREQVSQQIIEYFGFDPGLFPSVHPLFSEHGSLSRSVATRLSLKPGIPISYKAGDQPNNALSLNVLNPGEVAATAGTSGVIYGVSDQLSYDNQSRINSFAHVNHSPEKKRIGILLCINGAGIFNRWIKSIAGANLDYIALNQAASQVPIGAEGLTAIPFGNGAERMLNNRSIGAHFHNLDFNTHSLGHMVRSIQEGIAFSFRYGLDIMRENGINPNVVRAGRSNLFLSEVFTTSFVNTNNVAIEFYEGDGSYGAAIGAGIGAGIYKDANSAGVNRKPSGTMQPADTKRYEELYSQWKNKLELHLEKVDQEGFIPSFS